MFGGGFSLSSVVSVVAVEVFGVFGDFGGGFSLSSVVSVVAIGVFGVFGDFGGGFSLSSVVSVVAMGLPERINSDTELEEVLAEPSDADVACVSRLTGDVLILGAGGKMGPSLARRIHRALARAGGARRVIAASRFSSADVRASLDADGIQMIACDLLDSRQIAVLPRCESVLFLAGRKFGTLERTDLTWTTNTVVPARVAEHFRQSRMVVFSTGNVYPLVAASGRAPTEDHPPAPVGEYAQSCLGRERVVEFVSREERMPAVIFRLNYAVDLRYGTLVDIARRVFTGEPVDLTMGFFNTIWQGDANSYALRSLELCSTPPTVLNVTGPERISVREIAHWFGSAFGRPARFVNQEGTLALLSDSSRCRARLGEPAVPLPALRQWVAHWVKAGGTSLNKPTHFEVVDGGF
jgi:nucleoside-diphosphate-sugar epimerase